MRVEMIYRNNELQENGEIDKQIINDFREAVSEAEKFQLEHLDTEKTHNHYSDWTMKNQLRIAYANRIVELLEGAE